MPQLCRNQPRQVPNVCSRDDNIVPLPNQQAGASCQDDIAVEGMPIRRGNALSPNVGP